MGPCSAASTVIGCHISVFIHHFHLSCHLALKCCTTLYYIEVVVCLLYFIDVLFELYYTIQSVRELLSGSWLPQQYRPVAGLYCLHRVILPVAVAVSASGNICKGSYTPC